MNTKKLYQILQETTKVYRKGAEVERKKAGNIEVIEIYGYPHTSKAEKNDKSEKVDMIFVDILVDKEKARLRKEELENILDKYPQPERLAGGPSYIELAPNLEMEQEEALRLMALGKILGLWNVVSGKTLGMDDTIARELAGNGFLMIEGYRRRK